MWLEEDEVTEVRMADGTWRSGINLAPGMTHRVRRRRRRVWISAGQEFWLMSNILESCIR